MRSLQEVIRVNEAAILASWLDLQQQLLGGSDVLKDADRREQSQRVLAAVAHAAQSGNLENIHSSEWKPALDTISETSTARALSGSTSSEIATFFFSLKQPIFSILQKEFGGNPAQLTDSLWKTTTLLDKLGLFSIEAFQKSREEVIRRQQQDMLELSTPVVKLFEEIIALPLIGTLDSARTQVVMENLLENIVSSSASIAILDITGVPTVDTQVAQHLLKTVAAARLMGADCIISGVRPQIAQTIVHLGVELQNVTTKATMADALKVALQRQGFAMVRRGA
jgi:rsbT co-antagonist protein RsbR